MATKPPETTGGPQEPRTPNPPPTLRLAPNTPPSRQPTPSGPGTGWLTGRLTGRLTGNLGGGVPRDDMSRESPLTGPLDPWPDVLEIAGSPIVVIDLHTGAIGSGEETLGHDELAVLRVLAQRHLQSKHANRALIHFVAFAGQGDPSRVDGAIAALKKRPGYVVDSGPDAWQLYSGPD